METKVKDEWLGDVIIQCLLKYFSKGNPKEIPYFDEEELDPDQDELDSDKKCKN